MTRLVISSQTLVWRASQRSVSSTGSSCAAGQRAVEVFAEALQIDVGGVDVPVEGRRGLRAHVAGGDGDRLDAAPVAGLAVSMAYSAQTIGSL